MKRWPKKLKLQLLCLGIALVMGGCALVARYTQWRSTREEEAIVGLPGEAFDPRLINLTTLQACTTYLEQKAAAEGISTANNLKFVAFADAFVRKRFKFSYSQLTPAENYLAALAGQYIWADFSGMVYAQDIIRHSTALCSQQSIVLMKLLQLFGYATRPVYFPHHYCVAVHVQGKWHFLDPTFEAHDPISTSSVAPISQLRGLLSMVGASYSTSYTAAFSLGPINQEVAPRMRVFQAVTYLLSWWGWALFLGIAVLLGLAPSSRTRLNS